MAVKQISVFIENRVGGLAEVTDALGSADINIRALSISETSDFGILRLIVDDVNKAAKVMKDGGFICQVTDVLAVAGEDKPGSIAKIISALTKGNIDMEYAYAFFAKNEDLAYMIVRVDDAEMDRAAIYLRDNGIQVVDEEDVMKL